MTIEFDALQAFREFQAQVWEERENQLGKWGPQMHKQSEGHPLLWKSRADHQRGVNDKLNEAQQFVIYGETGPITWEDIFMEEVYEAMAEEEWPERRAELIQCAAVIAAMIEDGDNSYSEAPEPDDQSGGRETQLTLFDADQVHPGRAGA